METLTGQRVERDLRLDADQIAQFATLCGDQNPVHHDPEFAAGTRFGGIIASGPQTSALLMGLSATWLGEHSPMLGLEFRFRFRRAVKADEDLQLHWQVVAERDKPSLGGRLVFLVGGIQGTGGEEKVRAVGKALLTQKL